MTYTKRCSSSFPSDLLFDDKGFGNARAGKSYSKLDGQQIRTRPKQKSLRICGEESSERLLRPARGLALPQLPKTLKKQENWPKAVFYKTSESPGPKLPRPWAAPSSGTALIVHRLRVPASACPSALAAFVARLRWGCSERRTAAGRQERAGGREHRWDARLVASFTLAVAHPIPSQGAAHEHVAVLWRKGRDEDSRHRASGIVVEEERGASLFPRSSSDPRTLATVRPVAGLSIAFGRTHRIFHMSAVEEAAAAAGIERDRRRMWRVCGRKEPIRSTSQFGDDSETMQRQGRVWTRSTKGGEEKMWTAPIVVSRLLVELLAPLAVSLCAVFASRLDRLARSQNEGKQGVPTQRVDLAV
ncbi:hypothetical protein B0H14DRAFT_2600382 [Mycena olivaceomarginata]|nr:hypothetical protein B0H14DRAFT_2600382 [Mycena olivaceomarginata]